MLTAAKAKEITKKSSVAVNNRELCNIVQKIAEAAQKGRNNITVYNVHETTLKKLEALGYSVNNLFYRNELETIISWEE